MLYISLLLKGLQLVFIQPRIDALGSSNIGVPLFTQYISVGLLTSVTLHASEHL